MHRRDFLAGSLTGAAILGAPSQGVSVPGEVPAEVPAPKQARMVAGHQNRSSDADLRVLAALGVKHICSTLPSRTFDDNWSVDGLTKLRQRVESFGVQLDMVPLPLSSSPIERSENPHILLGQSPERDHEIDNICQMIRNVAKAGIPAVKYNLTMLGVVRTEPVVGRGGARGSAFNYDKARPDGPPPQGGPVSVEVMWERITYFLERVVPVAEESKVRICCHPNDPGLPRDKPFRGIHCPLATVEGLQKFVDIAPSRYHGLNFCQGTISEMLAEPGREIYDVIRRFGKQGKIFNVHFRNIKGGLGNFHETFPDNGDVDMVKALRTYQEVGYEGMIMPDHAPEIEGDTGKAQAFAFEFGYIQGLLQAIGQ